MFLSVVSISKNYVLAWFEPFSYFILDAGSWLLLSQILPSLCVTFIQQWLFYFNLFYSFSFFFLIKREEVGDCIQANEMQHECPHLNHFHRFPLSPAATVDPLPREYRSMGPKRDPENLGAHVILKSSHYLMQMWNYAEFHGFRKVNWIINFFLINGQQ